MPIAPTHKTKQNWTVVPDQNDGLIKTAPETTSSQYRSMPKKSFLQSFLKVLPYISGSIVLFAFFVILSSLFTNLNADLFGSLSGGKTEFGLPVFENNLPGINQAKKEIPTATGDTALNSSGST